MAPIGTFIDAYEALKIGYKIAEKQGWLDKLRYAFKKKHRVLVLGTTGCGKTNFIRSLTQPIPEAISREDRTEFAERHGIKIDDNPFIVVDTPGQAYHESRRRQALLDEVKHDVAGIINVVSYGYHEMKVGKDKALDASGLPKPEFLRFQREEEIASLAEWVDLLPHSSGAKWLITVATKADLWWDSRSQVREHYQNGAYFEALGPAKTLKPITLEYCSVIHKFYGTSPVSGNFDDADRQRLRNNLLVQVLSAVSQEKFL